MSDTVPTIRVKSGDSYAIINEADYDPSVHVLLDGETAPAPTSASLAGDLASSDASGAASTETPPVAIPADWADLHHNAKIKLAETILGIDDLVLEGEETKTEAAVRVITAEVAKRA